MEIEKTENGLKVTVPLITDEDIKKINGDFDGIVHRFSKMIIHDKDLAIAQYIIKKQEEQINELKKGSISKKKIEDEIEELKQQILKYNEYRKLGNETDIEFYENIGNEMTKKFLQELLEDK